MDDKDLTIQQLRAENRHLRADLRAVWEQVDVQPRVDVDELLRRSQGYKWHFELRAIITDMLQKRAAGIYDITETHPDCTVQVLKNSTTGAVSVGWWENQK